MNNPFAKNRIAGIIKYVGLSDFWMSLNQHEKDALIRYYRGALGADPKGSPIKGDITFSTQTQLNYLDNALTWAVSEKDYSFADKLIARAERSILEVPHTSTSLHFFLQNSAECYYKQRESRTDALEKTVEYCVRDIQAFPEYSKEMIDEFGSLPRILTFQRLAILYEKAGQYQEAIQICDIAIQYGLYDGTKGGYEGRKQRLLNKLGG